MGSVDSEPCELCGATSPKGNEVDALYERIEALERALVDIQARASGVVSSMKQAGSKR